MIPLLFVQSLLIGAGFGIGYQGTRRKLSAMSNEKFNETDLGLLAFDEFKGILARQDFAQMLDLMHPLTDKLAVAFGELLKKLPSLGQTVIDEALAGGGGAKLPPAGVPAFLTPIIGPHPKVILDNPQINPPSPTVPGLNANEQFALRWLNPKTKTANLQNITFKEISFLLQLRAKKLLFMSWSALGSILLNRYNQLKPVAPSPGTVPSGSSKVATDFGALVALLDEIRRLKIKLSRGGFVGSAGRASVTQKLNNKSKRFLLLGSAFNRYVASIRRHNLSIDTAKSIQQNKIIPK